MKWVKAYDIEKTLTGINRSSLGIAVLLQKICTPYLDNLLILSIILKDYPLPCVNAYAIYPSRKQIPTKLRVFLDYLEKVFPQTSL